MPTLPQRSVRLSILQVTTLLALGAPPLLLLGPCKEDIKSKLHHDETPLHYW